MERPMPQLNDLSRSLITLEQDTTLIAVIEMGQSSWLVAGIVPGVERQPLKKLGVDEGALLKLLHRWREEAEKAGRRIKRIAVAFEAGRDGFWLARWLRARSIEVHVIHASSVALSREHRRAKTDRLDTELLKRAFLGLSLLKNLFGLRIGWQTKITTDDIDDNSSVEENVGHRL
jgi:transposase